MECGVCFLRYDSNNLARVPLLLECGHTFCKACVCELLSKNPNCPLCRTRIIKRLPDLKTNFALLDVLNSYQMSDFKHSNFSKNDFPFIDKTLISEIPPTNPIISQKLKVLGSYIEFLDDPETSEIPYEGPFKYLNGDIYLGQMKNGLREGLGTQIYYDGSRYDGIWRNDVPNIKGRIIYTNSDYYEGDWKNGQKHGTGKFNWADGSFYEGNFDNGIINGSGTFYWNDGRIYEGEWKNAMMHGKGSHTLADGSKFMGEYFEDKIQGFGIYEWSDGSRYVGSWKNGVEHGVGLFKVCSGKESKGEWDNGKIIKFF